MTPSNQLQPFVFKDPDNDDEHARWCIFVMAKDEQTAEKLAIAQVAQRMASPDDDAIPAEVGGEIIRAIVSNDALDNEIEFTSREPFAYLLIVKLIPADDEE